MTYQKRMFFCIDCTRCCEIYIKNDENPPKFCPYSGSGDPYWYTEDKQ